MCFVGRGLKPHCPRPSTEERFPPSCWPTILNVVPLKVSNAILAFRLPWPWVRKLPAPVSSSSLPWDPESGKLALSFPARQGQTHRGPPTGQRRLMIDLRLRMFYSSILRRARSRRCRRQASSPIASWACAVALRRASVLRDVKSCPPRPTHYNGGYSWLAQPRVICSNITQIINSISNNNSITAFVFSNILERPG